jgi:transcriptional regulator with XRE-family HTH domain
MWAYPKAVAGRVTGLRREKVAVLAGISAEYYPRLEQGKERQPSAEMIARLALALHLNDDAVEYMCNPAHPGHQRQRRITPAHIEPHIQNLIERWSSTPTYVQGRRLSVLAANPLARALSPFFRPGADLLRATFLESEMHTFARNWNDITAVLVAWLRFVLGAESTADPELLAAVCELRASSQRFRTLWARHDVKRKTAGIAQFLHPEVGSLDLYYRTLVVPETDQILVTYDAEKDSPSEQRLRLLSETA